MTLAAGARVGTCSARRTAQVRMMRDDLAIVPLRGNVPTRVARINDDLDAIVLARAGLVRLGLDDAISEVFDSEQMLPAPAQGAMAIQCRTADRDLILRLSALNHEPTRRAVDAERAMLHALGGGCSVPVGALAHVDKGDIYLTSGAFSLARFPPCAPGPSRRSVEGGAPPLTISVARCRRDPRRVDREQGRDHCRPGPPLVVADSSGGH